MYDILLKGSNIRLSIIYNCEYGFLEKKCIPEYRFDRFDASIKDNMPSNGFNYRQI